MGILNVTPDSFSDGGRFVANAHPDVPAAVEAAAAMIAAGAQVIDIGGESSRPGARPVDPAVEAARVLPVIEAVAGLGVRVSVDTRHEQVARAAVAAGASIINDISASLWAVAADLGVGWVAMHMAGSPATMQAEPHYDDVVDEVLSCLLDRARQAASAGVTEMWIDPGLGFGKSFAHNVALLAAADRFVATGIPVALGISRKHSTGLLSARADASTDASATASPDDPTPATDRLDVSLAIATWAMIAGVSMIRAHDVRPHVDACKVVAGQISDDRVTARPAPLPTLPGAAKPQDPSWQ